MERETEERLLGVLTSLRLFLTNYDLFLTNRRIIAAKASSAVPGVLAFGVAGLALTPGNPDRRLGRYAGMTLDQILSAARKNFAIPYDRVERALLDGGRSNVTMPTLKLWASGKKMMFAFTQSMWRKDHAQMALAKQLVSAVLPGRIDFQRI
jgi:hypothetical protein